MSIWSNKSNSNDLSMTGFFQELQMLRSFQLVFVIHYSIQHQQYGPDIPRHTKWTYSMSIFLFFHSTVKDAIQCFLYWGLSILKTTAGPVSRKQDRAYCILILLCHWLVHRVIYTVMSHSRSVLGWMLCGRIHMAVLLTSVCLLQVDPCPCLDHTVSLSDNHWLSNKENCKTA